MQTQPSAAVACLVALEPLEWSFAVVFHPDTRRIGTQAVLPADVSPLHFGRYVPEFAGPGAATAALEDRHVSRSAGALVREDIRENSREKRGWRLQRGSGRSSLRVDGEELEGSRRFTEDELRAGLSLTLGNRVVLFLRLQARQSGIEGASAGVFAHTLAETPSYTRTDPEEEGTRPARAFGHQSRHA